MAKLVIKNELQLQGQIKKALTNRMARVFAQGPKLMLAQGELLRDIFANSKEYNDVKGRLQGEFGFTNAEVSRLDRILELLVPGNNEITVSKIQSGPSKFLMQLEWVDLAKLKAHEFAQHVLTKLDSEGNITGITDIISWVEWLEEGETFRGFEFFRPGPANEAFSRSGQGLMRRSQGNFFSFEPTRVFEKIAKKEVDGNFLKKGFGLLVKKIK